VIVWGGCYCAEYWFPPTPPPPNEDYATGALYDPTADAWTPTSAIGAPSPRRRHAAVWTGSRMIVWGGISGGDWTSSGGVYDPAADSWTTVSTAGAPAPLVEPTAVWTGSHMIVWGANGVGGLYDPATDSWAALSTVGAPAAWSRHAAVWTGSRMIVWGSRWSSETNTYENAGALYDPASDTWAGMSAAGAPCNRLRHTAVWTGSRMVVWGGSVDPVASPVEPAALYDPATDAWSAGSPVGAPTSRRGHSAVWTGSRMIVWGGQGEITLGRPRDLSTGFTYDPATDVWSAILDPGSALGRSDHTAVWTGFRMVVWGGATHALGGPTRPPGPVVTQPLGTGAVYARLPSAPRDLDGDGHSDLLWRHEYGALYAWMMDGAAVREQGFLPAVGTGWRIAAFADFDADGRADLLWREVRSGATYVWLMDGTAVVSGGFTGQAADPSWSVAGAGDFDGDGRDDLLWRQSGGDVYVWLMDGTGVRLGPELPFPVSPSWTVEGVGDLDGDDRADVLWRDASTGATFVWFMQGTYARSCGFTDWAADLEWTVRGLGDLNGDGRNDVLWRHVDGSLILWVMKGLGLEGEPRVMGQVGTAWQVEALGDYDGDGRADILWREETSGATGLWFMDGPTATGLAPTGSQADRSWTVQAP
jgi:hypothetical protein